MCYNFEKKHIAALHTRAQNQFLWTQTVPFSMCFWGHKTVLIEKNASDFRRGIWKKKRELGLVFFS